MQATQRSTHLSLVLRLLPQLWVYGQDPEQGQQPFWTTAIVLCHHSAAQEPHEGMERASFWRCARLLICISDADAAPQCSQLALRSLDAPAHWAIMTAAARRLVTTSAASNASVARVPAVPQSRRAPIRRTSCKPGRPKGPPTQTAGRRVYNVLEGMTPPVGGGRCAVLALTHWGSDRRSAARARRQRVAQAILRYRCRRRGRCRPPRRRAASGVPEQVRRAPIIEGAKVDQLPASS